MAAKADDQEPKLETAKKDRDRLKKWTIRVWHGLKHTCRSERWRLSASSFQALPEPIPSESTQSLLFILHKGAGGTRFTSEDLSRVIAQRYPTFVLLTALDHWSLHTYAARELVPVRSFAFSALWRVDRPLSSDRLAALREICTTCNVAVAHVRHLLGNGPELLELLHEEGIPIVFSFHDFYTVCPTIQLLDENRDYCAGACTASAGDCPLPANWYHPPLPRLKHHFVYKHRASMARSLSLCDFFITTSHASRELLTKHFPELDRESFVIIEHGRDLVREELASFPVKGEPIRALFFGELTPSKGLRLMLDLLKENRQTGSPIQLHLLGKMVGSFNPEEYGVIYHGLYQRHELPEHVRAIRPSVSLVPSPWPETYCHVLTESWAMGLPVMASDIGTLRERVLRHQGGWLLPVDDGPRWFKALCGLIDDRPAFDKALEDIRRIQIPDVLWMAQRYDAVYQRLFSKRAGRRLEKPT